MIEEVSIGGIFFPAWAIVAVIALIAAICIGNTLRVLGLYRLIWHTGLFDLALFIVLWGGADALWLRLPTRSLGLE